MLRLAADIGGTFTDLVAYDEADGGLSFVKALTTPQDPAQGVLDALVQLARTRNQDVASLLVGTSQFLHGTTVATNALAQGVSPRIGMLTTRGFRDVLELREGTKQDRYRLRLPYPEALIPRELRLEVTERLAWDGSVTQPLDEADALDAIARLRSLDIEILVIGLLHAHANPVHERRLAALVRAGGWELPVVLSHEILNRQGEYPRFSTAAVNAYVTPALAGYLRRLEGTLAEHGKHLPVLVVQSSGGLLPATEAGRLGVGCVTSGPAGGALAAAFLTRAMGGTGAVAFDIGGTTTDISLIEDGRPAERQRTDSDSYAIALPSIDIHVHAIGGGSLASVDAGGLLTVGPRSAGAMPGPAAYGRGGEHATVTDAAIALGYLSADGFMDGRLPLSLDRARDAVRRDVAEPLGLAIEPAARAIWTLAATRVAEGVRAATVGRGIDPRDLTLMAFGGAGGLYMDLVARELEIETAVAPRAASVLSAFGFLAAPVRFEDGRTIAAPLDRLDPARLQQAADEMAEPLRRRLAAAGFAPDRHRLDYAADCRYRRQVGTVEVRLPPGEWAPAAIAERFADRYAALYGHRHPHEICVVETLRVSALGLQEPPQAPRAPGAKTTAAALMGSRPVFGATGWSDWPVYDFEALAPGQRIAGPALFTSSTTTIVAEAGSLAEIDPFGSLRLRPAAA